MVPEVDGPDNPRALARRGIRWSRGPARAAIQPPCGRSVLRGLRVAAGAYNIQDSHLADAIELLVKRTQASLSDDRAPRHAYPREVAGP